MNNLSLLSQITLSFPCFLNWLTEENILDYYIQFEVSVLNSLKDNRVNENFVRDLYKKKPQAFGSLEHIICFKNFLQVIDKNLNTPFYLRV